MVKKKKSGPDMAELTLRVEMAQRKIAETEADRKAKAAEILSLEREILTYKMQLKNTEMLQDDVKVHSCNCQNPHLSLALQRKYDSVFRSFKIKESEHATKWVGPRESAAVPARPINDMRRYAGMRNGNKSSWLPG